MNTGPDLVVNSVAFHDDVVEIQYVEAHDQGDHVTLLKAIMFEAKIAQSEVDELMSDIIDLIDVAFERLRNPPMTRPSGLGR